MTYLNFLLNILKRILSVREIYILEISKKNQIKSWPISSQKNPTSEEHFGTWNIKKTAKNIFLKRGTQIWLRKYKLSLILDLWKSTAPTYCICCIPHVFTFPKQLFEGFFNFWSLIFFLRSRDEFLKSNSGQSIADEKRLQNSKYFKTLPTGIKTVGSVSLCT